MSTNNFNKFLLVSIGFIAAFLLFSLDVNAAIIHKPPTNLGLVGYWSFNEGAGTLATDFSGNGNTGTLTNGPFWVAGKRGKALSFDGSNDYVDTGPTNMPGATSITVALWIYVGASDFDGTVKVVMGDASDPNGSNGFYLALDDRGGGNLTNGVYIELDSTGGVVDVNANNVIGERRWYHIATAYSASTGRIYVDGRDVTSSSVGSGSFIPDTNQNLTIGQVDGGWFTKAIFDEVRIYNRALTLSEVEGLYKSGAVAHKNPSNLGLVGYWSFNEGTSTQAGDSSGNNNGGQLTNGPFWVAGKRGKALDFDGVNDYVIVSDSDSLDTPNALTVAAWIYDSNDGTQGHTINKDTSSGNRNWIVRRDTNTVGNYHVWNSGGTLRQLTPAGSWKINEWFHMSFVVSVSGSTINLRVFINGVSVGTDSFAGTAIQTGTSPLHMGKDFATGTFVKRQRLDEVRIYNRALSADEIKILYQGSKYATVNASQNTKLTNGLVGFWSFNGPDVNLTHPTSPKAFDRSGNGNDGILTNGPVAAIGKIGSALNFDGVNDYVSVPSSQILTLVDPFTLTAWIKTADQTTFNHILDRSSTVNDKGYAFSVGDNNSPNIGKLALWTGMGWTIGNKKVNDGQYHHVIGVLSSNTVYLYIDGLLDKQASVTPNLAFTGALRIGDSNYDTGDFPGLIDEVRIYNRALSADEIKRLYNMGR